MDAQALIEIYQTGFYASAATAALGLMLAVFFFFRFRINSVWAIRTGRAQRKAVQELQEASRSDGRMRKDEKRRQMTTEEMAGTEAESTEPLEKKEVQEQSPPQWTETVLLSTEGENILPKETLSFGETEVLAQTGELNQTSVLSETAPLEKERQPADDFLITQEVVLIHTTEKIP